MYKVGETVVIRRKRETKAFAIVERYDDDGDTQIANVEQWLTVRIIPSPFVSKVYPVGGLYTLRAPDSSPPVVPSAFYSPHWDRKKESRDKNLRWGSVLVFPTDVYVKVYGAEALTVQVERPIKRNPINRTIGTESDL